MSRALWFAAGAGAGVYAMTRLRRAAEAFSPDGLRDRLAGLSLAAHLFTDEVRAGMTEKETELRSRVEPATDDDDTALQAPRLQLTREGTD